MSKREKKDIENEELKNNQESECSCNNECSCDEGGCGCQTDVGAEILIQLENKTKQCEELVDLFQRAAAEFDNYKKKDFIRKKEAIYSDSVSDIITAFLPVIDSLERAQSSAEADISDKKITQKWY